MRTALLGLLLAGCGLPLPENASFGYDVAGLHYQSVLELSPDYLSCDVGVSRAEFARVLSAEKFDATVASVGVVWVGDERAVDAAGHGGLTDGHDLILPRGGRGLLHELFHVYQDRNGLSVESQDHLHWDDAGGFNDAQAAATAKAYACPNSPFVKWTPLP